ncbi:hypothetical protein MPTK1_5g06050 [Marchantia polymorpha subsp. ruderalis]|uniref:O-fucosyltransferase family protein n=2 Tax=Marchantia polymorpha TaxID=3197 RepID=A0AAF6BFG0_MARPO|nr:hypothetical protein MARPO_0027s0023 [Marchantia polymorpha]BBN10744.1 hypothetical protein Mp_5g06050 [Marchantia polymorpha subsp. ruderalis]|eukprot:PTQ42890.1 hypothetical protein MARPO_0027s0023 [Marchantia polymorpha]
MRVSMGSVLSNGGRPLRPPPKEKAAGISRIVASKKTSTVLLCTLFIFLISARSIANWLSTLPDLALRISSGAGPYSSCVNFTDPLKSRHESLSLLPHGEQYMLYSPHEGFSNQARELKNALQIALLLNRTLILPPVVDHGEVKHGRCLKPRYPTQRKLKERSWSAVRRHISQNRYVAIADIVDLRSLTPRLVRTIDLRVFLALWCGVDIAPVCAGPQCRSLASSLPPSWGSLATCRQRLFPAPGVRSCLVYDVEDDCPTTIWTNGESDFTREFMEHQLMQKLRNDPDMSNRTSLMHAESGHDRRIVRKDIVKTLGPGSEAGQRFLLSFGSLFSRMYKHMELHVNIRAALGDEVMESKLEAIKKGLPFTKEIMRSAKQFVKEEFANRPYFCAHVRLGDGAFVHVWDKIFRPLRKKLEQLSQKWHRKSKRLHIFLMTDLARESWNGTLLAEVDASDRFMIHTLDGHQYFLNDTAHQTTSSEHGLRLGFVPQIAGLEPLRPKDPVNSTSLASFVPDVRLYVEEVVCACASLGFQGTFRSTVTTNINEMRTARLCPV